MTFERDNISHSLVAFIVDQYLSRNQFYQTQATFRNEASSLFANSPPNQNLMSLEEMLNQYVFMKNQNIVLEKEKVMVMQEKNRIQMLLKDMQNALDSFYARSPLSNATTIITNSAVVPLMQNSNTNPSFTSTRTIFPTQNTMALLPIPVDNVRLSSPMIRVFDKKRKDTSIVNESTVVKKPRGRPPDQKNKVQGIKTPLPSLNNKVNVISTNGVIVEPVKQMVCKEDNHDISPIEAHTGETNKENTNYTSKGDTTKISTKILDKSFPNEIPTSSPDKDRADWAHLEFSNIELDDWSEVDFSNFE